MEKISKEIFYHKIGYDEKAPDSEEYRKKKQECDEAYEKLNRTLSEEQQKLLDDLWLRNSGVLEELEYLNFNKGFRSGLLLILELCEQDE